MDYTEMHAMRYREENGYLPDEIYYNDGEDTDPEIAQLVSEQYAATNEKRRAERDQDRISVLEQLLRDNGIKVPE